MNKKLIALLLTAVMTVTLLAGCGKGNETEKKEETQNPGTETDTSEEYPVIRINYAIMGGNDDEEAVEERLNEIMREKAGAEIDLIGIEFGNWSTQMNLMLTGGENSLDLFSSFWYTSESNLVANGQVMALDELLESDGAGILGLYEGLEEYLNCARIDGSLYGIPSIYAWCSENMYLVDKNASDAAGIDWDQVSDLDSLTEAMIAMKEASSDKYFIPGSTDPYFIPKSIDYLGDTNFLGVMTDPTNSTVVENYYESEFFLNFLEYVKVWKEHDLFSPDPLSNSNPVLVNMQYGVAAGSTGYTWDTSIGIKTNESSMGMELVGAPIGEALATTGEVTTYMWHISSFCKNPEAAMRVLNVLYTDPEAAQLAANGIEGLEYEMNADGQMEYPEGKTLMDLGWAAASMAYWPNVTICETWAHEPDDIYDLMTEKNKSAEKSLALGFQFNSNPVADQMTACTNVVAQYYMPLMFGEVDIDSTLAEFQNALKNAGIDDIVAEKQAQLDEWLESQ